MSVRLYFICDLHRTAVKIGVTRRDPELRLKDLQAGSPVELCVEHVVTAVPSSIEIDLHQHFARHWRHREWFDYHDSIKLFVDDLIRTGHSALSQIPPAPYPKGFRTADGWLVSREDILRYLRDGVSRRPWA